LQKVLLIIFQVKQYMLNNVNEYSLLVNKLYIYKTDSSGS